MPTYKNVNSVVSKDSPILQCNQPVIHFPTEKGLKKDIFMSSNLLSVSLAECFSFFLGGGGVGGWGRVLFEVQHNLLELSAVHHAKTYNNI